MLFKSRGSASVEFIIAGLGNPGSQYENTRHNIGFRAVDFISGAFGCDVKRLRHYALTGKCERNSKGILLMKPQTYMNNSGEAVGDAARFYKIEPSHVIIISDDISLPEGTLRIRKKGSSGGHNGHKSIAEHLGTEDYPRIKIGVGEVPSFYGDSANYVLAKMTTEENNRITSCFDNILKACQLIISGETDKAMSLYNKPAREKTDG